MAPTSASPHTDDEVIAQRRARYLVDLLWHAGAFVILNAGFWMLDLLVGQSGVQWAYWITGPWAFALAFHVLAYAIDGRAVEQRRATKYLESARR